MPDTTTKAEQTASIVGFVIEMGEEAYKDDQKVS